MMATRSVQTFLGRTARAGRAAPGLSKVACSVDAGLGSYNPVRLTTITPARIFRGFSSSSITRRAAAEFTGMSEQGLSESQVDVRRAIQDVCSQFDEDYWRHKDQRAEYPHELYDALSSGRWIGICMPESLGGAGLGISEATVMLQTIAESGGAVAGAQSIHANIYPLMPIIEFASKEQHADWLPKMIDGRIRSCFGITEPTTGSETLKLKTKAVRKGDKYIINGSKIWTSSAQVASHVVLLARTSEPESGSRSSGLSLFFAPLRNMPNNPQNAGKAQLAKGVEMRKIAKMGGNMVDANEVWFDDFEVPADCLIGEEGKGFKYVLHGMNAERCLLAGEALGTGYAALTKAVKYAGDRVVFGKPIGAMQAIQHPLAKSWAQLEAAKHLTYAAARMYDDRAADAGAQANAAKYMAAEAGFKACETAVMTLGGMGYAVEYGVERLFREVLVPRLAPVR
ncbi:acyl-CoA dehydrogenase [Pseudozyma hubeiensis SY62]|uniref:Acyl-CoA dehydrogenase n=1 Tax=Pseudozyma hubeiensis (strain SY62) TaxID=1305764 RepID=R9PDY6_PSEHS|nr:acyl-CoA dehydrogenase [Pseudozyma hubeiensis SY62]GAC99452.1 acyl-CoA dehydrogenase [Pseudozyma hubeiensis SY62]